MGDDATVTFESSADRLFEAVLRTVASLNYSSQHTDRVARTVLFNTGMSWRSWAGQDMTAIIVSDGDTESSVTLSGTRAQRGWQMVDWGELGSIQRKFLKRLETVLPSVPEPAPQPPQVVAASGQTVETRLATPDRLRATGATEERRRLRRIIAVMFVLGLVLAAVSIGLAWGGRALGWWGGQAGPSLQPPSAWKSFTSADGGFSIEFPGDAEPLSSDAQGLAMKGLDLATSAGTFTVMWTDVPGWRADYGPAIAEGQAADMSATIVSQGDAEVGGLPGYQFVLAPSKCGPSIPGACRVTWQVLPVGNRIYQLVTVTPDPPETSPLTDRFLTSFKPRL